MAARLFGVSPRHPQRSLRSGKSRLLPQPWGPIGHVHEQYTYTLKGADKTNKETSRPD